MNVDPDTQALLDLIKTADRPPFETLSPAEAREVYAASRRLLQPAPEEVAEVHDTIVQGLLGPIPVRIYRAAGTEAYEVLPALVFYHGGGWVLGDLDSHDVVCRRFANTARCRVISVDYRLAPEHVFPAAVDDCAAVTKWVFDNTVALGVDPKRVAAGGDSAGGNLAAVMALMSRDGDLPPIAFQMLIYPAVDMAMTTVSSTNCGPGVPLTSATMKWFIDLYAKGHETDWRASPIRAASLAGTAPALVLTCGVDPLHDEGIDYAKRLEREGVRVRQMHFSDQIHGFIGNGKMIRAAEEALDIAGRALRLGLG